MATVNVVEDDVYMFMKIGGCEVLWYMTTTHCRNLLVILLRNLVLDMLWKTYVLSKLCPKKISLSLTIIITYLHSAQISVT